MKGIAELFVPFSKVVFFIKVIAGRSSDPNGLISHIEGGALPPPATNISSRYAPLVELVDTLVLEASASASEFESRRGHQLILWRVYA